MSLLCESAFSLGHRKESQGLCRVADERLGVFRRVTGIPCQAKQPGDADLRRWATNVGLYKKELNGPPPHILETAEALSRISVILKYKNL